MLDQRRIRVIRWAVLVLVGLAGGWFLVFATYPPHHGDNGNPTMYPPRGVLRVHLSLEGSQLVQVVIRNPADSSEALQGLDCLGAIRGEKKAELLGDLGRTVTVPVDPSEVIRIRCGSSDVIRRAHLRSIDLAWLPESRRQSVSLVTANVRPRTTVDELRWALGPASPDLEATIRVS